MKAKNKIQEEASKRIIKNFDEFKKRVKVIEITDPFTKLTHNQYYLSKGFNLEFHLEKCRNLKEAYKKYKEKSSLYDRAAKPILSQI